LGGHYSHLGSSLGGETLEMKRFTALAMTALAVTALTGTASATTKYWDINGSETGATPGANGIGDGTWDTAATNWNLDPTGASATTTWAEGDDAVFAAGSDLSSNPAVGGAVVTITGSHTPASLTIEEGFVELIGGSAAVAMAGNPILIKQGATLSIATQATISASANQVVTFDGGTFENHIIGGGSSFYNAGAATRWQLTANGGTVNTPNGGTFAGDSVNGSYSIMQYGSVTATSVVECAPGTVSCTLHKTGFGEFRASKNWTMTAVDVQQGLYRISNSTTNGGESGFGAPNGTVTVAGGAVANSTNGAALGTTANLTDDVGGTNPGVGSSPATRSFVLSGAGDTPDSMIVLNNNWLIKGNISGPGGLMLNGWARNDAGGTPNIIGTENELRLAGTNTYAGKTTVNFGTIVASGGSAIPNTSRVEFSTQSDWGVAAAAAANHRTFNTAVLRADSSETVGSLSGGSATRGSVNINGPAVTLTTGADGTTSTFSGSIGGTGGLSKTGGGTFTMDGTKSYTGNTSVSGGILSTNSASLPDAADVLLTSGGMFNLGFSGSDTIRSLFINGVAQAVGSWGGAGSGAVNISSLLSGTGTLNVTSAGVAPGVAGDYNGNGVVDMADYVLWRNGGPLQNEGSTVGTVDASDYDFWRAHFGNTSGSGSSLGSGSAVPEPGSLMLLLVAAGAILAGRNR
jgi:fibronectin-binding autotransporter adhesin